MSLAGRIRNRLRAALAHSRLEREMHEEMRHHMEEAAARFRARGLSNGDALVAARREFGNVGVVQEDARDARNIRWIDSFGGDLRYAIRQFARSPMLAATIVATLTLGIGVSSAAFTVLSGVFTRPAPGVRAAASLVAIRGIQISDGRKSPRGFSYAELMDYARLPEFAVVAGWSTSPVVVELGGEDAGTAMAQFVTPNFFRTLGLTMSAGTGFAQNRVDDHAVPELTAVIGYLYAVRKFGVAESAVGKTLRVNGFTVVIAGVAPRRFIGAFGDNDVRVLWLPVSAWPLIDRLDGDAFTSRAEGSFFSAGRLSEGTSIERALSAVRVVASRSASAAAVSNVAPGKRSWAADVVPLRGDVRINGPSDEIISVGMVTGLVLLILLVCTTTVSSLLVGAAVTRRHEIAVRLALGASRGRIVRQLLTESAVLALMAGATGLGAYVLIAHGLRDANADMNLDPTWGTVLVTVLFTLVTSVFCGLSPALHAVRDGVSGVLKDSSTNATARTRLQRVFVVSQIALAQPLLVGLVTMIVIVSRNVDRRASRTLAEHVVRADFDSWSAANRADNRMPALIARLSSYPGVVRVIPMASAVRVFRIEGPATGGAPARRFAVGTQEVPPGYFSGMDVPLIRGRELVARDSAAAVTPLVITDEFAAEVFGDADPVGRRLPAVTWQGDRRIGDVEIVGVVPAADVGSNPIGTATRVYAPMYGALAVAYPKPDALLIRTQGLAAPRVAAFQKIARDEAPELPVRSMKTLAEADDSQRSEILAAASAAAAGGGLTLILASIGLYAVVALSVQQRRREIGVRVSLGARPGQVVAMFFGRGLRVSLMGLVIGLPLSAAVLRIVSSQVGIPRTNVPAIAALVAMVVVIVASLASWIPARRAARGDPLIVLRDG